MPRILIVDDDPEIRETMASLIRRRKMEYDAVATVAETDVLLDKHAYDVVLLDVRLPDGDGLTLLPRIKAAPGSPEVVILTGRGDPDGAELAIQGGVWDYLVKPSSIKQISLSLARALTYREQKTHVTDMKALDLSGVVGQSPALRACFDVVAQAASTDSSALITGETGSGKELFARTIHANSRRRDKPFVAVDCAALTDSLVESTLFGHKKGAFTGAVADRVGLVELAHGGSLLLDEVGELPLTIQKALLRVLQERRFRPVGAAAERASDFRLLSATNRDLDAMVAQGAFRSDLLYRLKALHLHLPPLRERSEDVKPLAMHRINQLCERDGAPLKGFAADFFEMLEAYDWPGNVRELFNVLEQAFMAAAGEKTLYAMHLPQDLRIKVTRAQLAAQRNKENIPGMRGPSGGQAAAHPSSAESRTPGLNAREGFPTLKEYKSLAEARYIRTLADLADNDVAEMMRRSGLSRSHLYALLKKYGLSG